ncbi:MAG TPA: tetratricopeptide repeat protein [Cytophagales bacterium]|nr:tetratricopeptide repeat protein [Cytophagales bacterium]
MKKILFVVILSMIGSGAFAQNSEIMKAEMNFKKNILDKAKEHIDLAAEHEKTRDKSKTHLMRGRIYQAIFLDSGQYKTLAENPGAVAIASFNKANELENKKDKKVKIDSTIQAFYSNSLNVGAIAYKDSDFKEAAKYFKAASEMIPSDTTALLYLGVAAQQAEDYNTAKEAYHKLIDLGYQKQDIYSNLIYIARNVDKNEDEALKIIREARKLFPQEKSYAQEELNILISTNRLDEARKSLEEAIEREPNNANYYYNLGFMYDQTKETEKAIQNYEKAIELNPEYFEAHFNLGVVHYNKAADILKEVNAMDLSTYQKTGKKREAEGVALLKTSLPYFEKAYSINPEDMAVVETLQTIYSRLNRTADADRMKKVLEAHQGE